MNIEKLFPSNYIKLKNIKNSNDIMNLHDKGNLRYFEFIIQNLGPIFLKHLYPIKYQAGTFPFRSEVEGMEAIENFLGKYLLIKATYVKYSYVKNTEQQEQRFIKIAKLIEQTILEMLSGITEVSVDPDDQEIFILKKFNKLKYNDNVRLFLNDEVMYKINNITEKEGLDHLKKIYIQMIGSLFTLLFIIDLRVMGISVGGGGPVESILSDIGANPFLIADILDIFLRSFSFESPKKQKKIRKIGCEKIDFLTNVTHKKKRDEKILSTVIEKVADRNAYHGSNYDPTNIKDYCANRDWLYGKPSQGDCQLSKIPLNQRVFENDIIHRQYVLGRMENLEEYYKCHYFYTLDSSDWDNLYQLNDLFIYCAQDSEENIFPIRIVTDPVKGIRSKDKATGGITDYDKNLLTPFPHLLKQYKNITITSREICQLSNYFKVSFYQSIDYPHIFFATKKSKRTVDPYVKKYNLRKVSL